MPRPNKQSRPGTPGHAALQLPHVIALAKAAEKELLEYLMVHDTKTLAKVRRFQCAHAMGSHCLTVPCAKGALVQGHSPR